MAGFLLMMNSFEEICRMRGVVYVVGLWRKWGCMLLEIAYFPNLFGVVLFLGLFKVLSSFNL